MALSDGSERALRGVILTPPTVVEVAVQEQQEQIDGAVLVEAEVVTSCDVAEAKDDSETEADDEIAADEAAAHEAPPPSTGPLLLTYKPDDVPATQPSSPQPVEADSAADAPAEKVQLILYSAKPAVEGKRARLEVYDAKQLKKARFTANAPACVLDKEFKSINLAACSLRDALNPKNSCFGTCAGVNAKLAFTVDEEGTVTLKSVLDAKKLGTYTI